MIKNVLSKNLPVSLDNICTLIECKYGFDEYDNQIAEKTERICFCAEYPITSNEFFKGGQSGIKPEALLVLNAEDYAGEDKTVYNDKTYSIYRTYPRGDGYIEIYLTEKAGISDGDKR